MIPGADLAATLRPVWRWLRTTPNGWGVWPANCRIGFDVPRASRTLAVAIPLREPGLALRVALTKGEGRYFLVRGGEVMAAELAEAHVDRGVYRLLADLAGG